MKNFVGHILRKEAIKTRFWALCAILFMVTSFTMTPFAYGEEKSSDTSPDNRVIASVGEYKLTVDEFKQQIDSLPPQFKAVIAQNKDFRKRFVERWIDMTLMSIKAKKLGLDKDPDVQKRLMQLKRALLAQEVSKRFIEDKLTVTEDELKKFYDAHKDEYKEGEKVKARHILIKVPAGASDEAWEKARKKAIEIKKRLEKGEDFSELAKKFSDDPGTKDKGGELGYFGKGRMVPEFEKTAFSLNKGEISEPVKTIFGWHIIQVEDKKKARIKGFNEVKFLLTQKAKQEKKKRLQDELLKDIKKDNKVIINKGILDSLKIEAPKGMGRHGFGGGFHQRR